MGGNPILFSGVPYDGPTNFVWPYATGAFSPKASLVLSARRSEELAKIKNPISITGKVFWEEHGKGRVDNIDLRELYLRPPVPLGEHRFQWGLSDARWLVEKRHVGEAFDVTRQANEFIALVKDVRGIFNRAPKRHFIPHTCRLKGKNEFANALTDDGQLEFWTAAQALRYMLSRWFETNRVTRPDGTPFKPDLEFLVTDNERPLVNFATNQKWPQVVRRLLSLAHAGLYQAPSGQWIAFDLDRVELPSHVGGFEGGGNPVVTDLSRDRPARARSLFRLEREFRANHFERSLEEPASATTTVDDFDAGLAKLNGSNLDNVCILPQDVRDATTGEIYQRGRIVTIKEALDIWRQDPDNPPPPLASKPGTVGVDLATVRRHVLTGSLATLWVTSVAKLARRNELWASRVKTVYTAYRRLFRLDPRLLDMIEDIRAETGSIADPVTGKRPPAAVWMSHFRIPSSRINTPKGYTQGGNQLKPGANVYPWGEALKDSVDPKQLPLQGTEVSPCEISFVDKRQGLFAVEFLPDVYGDVYRFIRGTFPESPFFQYGFLLGTDTKKLSQMELEEAFQLSVLFSVTLRVPNNAERLEVVTADSKQTPSEADGPDADIFFGSMHAFRTWDDTKSQMEIDPLTGQLAITGQNLANESIINDLADAVFKDTYFEYENRVIGVFRARGHDDTADLPSGSYQTALEYTPGGALRTIYDSTPAPAPPPIWEFLPPDTQRVLYRLEDRPNP